MLFRTLSWALLALLTSTALADAPVLKIATSEYPPFEYLENGELKGKDADMVRRTVERMGYIPDFVVLPWARAESLARRGEIDMLFSLTHSPHRERFYHFTDPLSRARDTFFARSDANIEWSSLNDLEGLRIGIAASYSYAPEFMAWLDTADIRIVELSQESPELVGLRLLALNRIDLYICEHSVCNYLLDRHQERYPDLASLQPLPGTVGEERPFRAAFSRHTPDGRELRDRFNDALADLRNKNSE
ncbi:substrate-binding periplasmic protein [Marinobacter sp.]|uniref:substrate-binding periplasmic protein n=1 Tax=Marinobacter sp. TaxID=50741 RepID=UPI0034A0F2AC